MRQVAEVSGYCGDEKYTLGFRSKPHRRSHEQQESGREHQMSKGVLSAVIVIGSFLILMS
jgi:hypothetical protein